MAKLKHGGVGTTSDFVLTFKTKKEFIDKSGLLWDSQQKKREAVLSEIWAMAQNYKPKATKEPVGKQE